MVCNVTDFLERTAGRFPERTAVVDRNGGITYETFRRGVGQIACALIRAGLRRQSVAVCLEKDGAALQAI